jgi:hypothetical protein
MAGLLLLARLAAGGPEVRFEVRDVSGEGSSGVPVTLSALFAPGLFHDDDVTAVVADGPDGAPAVVATQVDVLSHHADGSLQHALVTLQLDVKPHATAQLYLVPSPQTTAAGPFASAAPPAPVLVELVDRAGGHWTASLAPPPPDERANAGADAVASDRDGPVFGPLAQEVGRRARLHGPAAELANVEVRVRWRRLSGVAATRVEVALENCPAPHAKDAAAAPAADDLEFSELAIFAGDVPLADQKGGVLFDGSRLVVRGFVGTAPPRLMIREDPVALARAAFLPPYDFTRPLSDAQANEQIRRIVASDMNGDLDPADFPLGIPLDPGPIVRYMPATGDRGDIGPIASWSVLALNSHSVVAEDAQLAADYSGAAAFPIHRRAAGGTMGDGTMGIDFASAAPLEKREHRIKCPLAPDRAHAPLLGYVAFLLTGDRFAEEELAAQAAFCFYDWPHDGNYRYPGSRDFAWSLRTTMLAAKVLPDANPLKRYLLERVRSNLKGMRGSVLECGQPLHAWGDGGFESSGRKTWPCATQKSPWQGAWVVASLDWTARLLAGDPAADDARALYEWLAQYYTRAYSCVGESFTAPDGTKVTWVNGHHALAYSFPAATYQPQLVGGEWQEKPGSMQSIGSFAEALWWLRVNLDHAFDPGQPPKLPPGPDGIPTLAPREWRPAAGYAPPPLPSPGWIEYSMHWLATVLEAEGTKGGHAVWVAVRPCIDSQVPLPGLRMSPEIWKR